METVETNLARSTRPELTVEKLVYGGAGLGRLEGRAVLVPFVLPGEVVTIEVKRERSGMAEARATAMLLRSPERVEPQCPYFARCGGCSYQHAGYEFQLAQKTAIAREVLRRVGKLEPLGEIAIVSGPPWEYRNRAQFHLDGGRIGFLETGSRRLCPVDRCPISSPRINDALAALRRMIRDRRFPRFLRSVELFTNEREVQLNVLDTDRPLARGFFQWCAEQMPGAGESSLEYTVGGEIYRVGHRSFFQVNRFLIDRLAECALDGVEGMSALDLYAGVGLFSLPLARRCRSVLAVESNASALRDLEFNAERAGLTVAARKATVEQFLETVEAPPDFVLADPPRAGLGKGVVNELLRLRVPVLTIVSCDPATLARDLAPLLAGGYRIDALTLIDLFPQTWHIETVTRLRLG
ncbi:MAG TPA: class I SAM-dependent RNA methyltransferase [Bryobacteraceae bacterium]|nr:class I SAM-dependent RNA methyltransferase [Bryobacteraceae bacterium]